MLYDPKWEVKAKPDVYSLAGLIAWLEKQPADEEYNYIYLRGNCVICQYLTSCGEPYGTGYNKFATAEVRIKVAAAHPQTFGAALERARKALGK